MGRRAQFYSLKRTISGLETTDTSLPSFLYVCLSARMPVACNRKMELSHLLILTILFALALLFVDLYTLSGDSPWTWTRETDSGVSNMDADKLENGRKISIGDFHQNCSSVPVEVRPSNKQVKVILVTYMRSGSSFTGELFNHHPNVFYVYEPLMNLQKQYTNRQRVFFFNKSPVKTLPENYFSTRSLAGSQVQAFLSCDFYSLDVYTLRQKHLKNSLSTKRFHDCKKRGLLDILKCLPKLFQSCRQAKISAVKTIRFSMLQAAALMKTDPTIKVIHLVRDPRATFKSQSRLGKFKLHMTSNSRDFCQRILNDLQQTQEMKKLFPGRVFSIRYEDLATEPLVFAEKVLALVGLSMNEDLRRYVWKITSAGLPQKCAFCTTRGSSWLAARHWRTELKLQLSRIVDEQCSHVYRMMGYLPLSTKQDLTNLTVPSYQEYSKVPGLWV